MDRPSLLDLRGSLQSRINGVNEKKQELLEAFRRDGATLGSYPRLLTNEELNTTQRNKLQTAIESRHGAEAYTKFLSNAQGGFTIKDEKAKEYVLDTLPPNIRKQVASQIDNKSGRI